MNKTEIRLLHQFPHALDQAIKKRFGVEANTELDFFGTMKHTTYFKATGELKIRINEFITGWIAGNVELRNRLTGEQEVELCEQKSKS